MRRKKQELTEKQCLDILRRAKTATLALSGDDGYPYSVPMNFVYEDGKIYFHGAKEGHKIDAIKNNPKVSMSIIDQEDDEIYHAIETLGLKYNEDEVTVEKEIQREWKALCCIEITIEHISGKQAIELVNKNYQDLF